jgi:hypothetical protein
MGHMNKSSKLNGLFQDKIARLLILGAFILVGVMLAIHVYSTSYILNEITKANNVTDVHVTFYREISSGNNNIFNIILALLGAWVGAVLAFYFGAQSVDKAYSSLNQAQQSIGNLVSQNKLSMVTAKQLIEKNPDTTRINKFKMSSRIKDIIKTAADVFPFVTITDDADKKVLGLLFISQITAIKPKAELESLDTTLEEFVKTNAVEDFILKVNWTKDGVKNYATVNTSDTLDSIVKAMNEVSPNISVRAIVFENEAIKAIIGHDHISKELKQ